MLYLMQVQLMLDFALSSGALAKLDRYRDVLWLRHKFVYLIVR